MPEINPAQKERTRLITALNQQAQLIKRQAKISEILAIRCEALEHQMAFLADASGTAEPLAKIGAHGQKKIAALTRTANPSNPAQPVMEPPPEAPVATNQTAITPDGRDDVTQLGATPVTDVSADASIAIDEPYGEVANTPVGMNRVDVTAPVDGTQYQRPPEETIVPVDVRVGNPDNPQPAFPWEMGPVGARPPAMVGPSVTSSVSTNPALAPHSASLDPKIAKKRTLASLQLARLQIQSKIAQGDDLVIAANIDNSPRSDQEILSEITTLSKVVNANVPTTPVPVGLVPRAASAQRVAPSLQSREASVAPLSNSVSPDEFIFE